jgi:glutamate racemase
MKNYILFMDSGIGGFSILKYFLNLKKNVNIIYYADTLNFPYGEKNETVIGNILLNIINNLKLSYNIDLVVIACNTASISALEIVRNHIATPVIGTVPAIKVAAEETKNNNIGIIGTETTVRLDYIKNLITKFAGNKNIHIKATRTLADAAEFMYTGEKLDDTLHKELDFFNDKNIDSLVLGCTHYSLLYDEINDFFKHRVNIIDSCDGVSRRIIQLLPEKTISNQSEKILFISKDDPDTYHIYESLNKKNLLFQKIITKDLSCPKV